MKNEEQFMEAIEFIVDSVVQNTGDENKSAIGIYLVSLVLVDKAEHFTPEVLLGLKALVEQLDEKTLTIG
jgi:hypothetical protein